MKALSLLIIITLFLPPSTQIIGKNYSGYIFNKDHFIMLDVGENYVRYTPTKEDIYKTEEIIKLNIKLANKNHVNQSGTTPIVHKNLNKYIRQYVGFINTNNEKVIWVNFIWGEYSRRHHLEKDIINVFDGGSYYWNVTVDNKNGCLYNLQVNGES